jgi:phenylacetate-CoA ligase
MLARSGHRPSGHVWSQLEALDAANLNELHLHKLKKQMSYVLACSDFYREKFKATGITIDDIVSLDSLENLPFTDKDELRASLDAHPPLGKHLCCDKREVAQLQASSGTTGKPSYIAYSQRDLQMLCEMTVRCFFAAGLRPGDMVIHTFAMSRGFVGGLPMNQSLALLGATVLPIGAESGVERLLGVIADQRPVGLIGAPSFVGYLGEQAEVVLGRPASELGVRHIVVGSEPGGGLPATRSRIERIWGASVREMYGLSDLGNSFWGESLDAEGMHFMGQGYLHAELIDPDSEKPLPFEKGVVGELVYTALEREAMPLVRFRSRDQVMVAETQPVGARLSPRVRVLGRTDDMLICRGVNVYPGAVQDVINGLRPLTTGLFKILVDFPGHSTDRPLRLRVESDAPVGDNGTAAERVAATVKDRLNVKVVVDIVPSGTYQSPASRKPVLIERLQPATA